MRELRRTVVPPIFAIFAGLCGLFGLYGCEKDEKMVDADVITQAIINEIEFPSAAEKTVSDLSDYYKISPDEVETASFYLVGSGAYPDEIAVVYAKEDKVNHIKALFEERLEKKREEWRDYKPEEMYKLDDAVISTKGNYIVFFASSDNDKAWDIFSEQIGN